MQTPALVSAARNQAGLTLREVAERAGIHFGTVWKAEKMSIRWETLHTVLTEGLGVPAGSRRYEEIKAAWLNDRLTARSKRLDTTGLTKAERAEVESFITSLISRRAPAASAPKRPAKDRPSVQGKRRGGA